MITRVHHQLIGAFTIPELQSEKHRHRLFSSETWFHFLQAAQARGSVVRRNGFTLRPIFDYDHTPEHYEERFWTVFKGRGAGRLTINLPFRMVLDPPVVWPVWDDVQKGEYRIRLRGRLYPYGAVCLRVSEYLRPASPITPEQVVKFFTAKFASSWLGAVTREGILGNLKTKVINSFVKRDPYSRHETRWYHLVHFETDRPVDEDLDPSTLSCLLAFGNRGRGPSPVNAASYENLGFAEKRQLVLLGEQAGLLYTPTYSFDDRGRVRGRKCLRNRVANLAELVMIQKQFYREYSEGMRQAAENYKFSTGRTFSEIEETLRPYIRFDELRVLAAVLRFHESLADTDEPVEIRWREWLSALSSSIFPSRSDIQQVLDAYNQVEIGVRSAAVAKLVSAMDHVVDLYSKLAPK